MGRSGRSSTGVEPTSCGPCPRSRAARGCAERSVLESAWRAGMGHRTGRIGARGSGAAAALHGRLGRLSARRSAARDGRTFLGCAGREPVPSRV
jgi:hypothetical protein